MTVTVIIGIPVHCHCDRTPLGVQRVPPVLPELVVILALDKRLEDPTAIFKPTPDTLRPQGLCTGYFLCLRCSWESFPSPF